MNFASSKYSTGLGLSPNTTEEKTSPLCIGFPALKYTTEETFHCLLTRRLVVASGLPWSQGMAFQVGQSVLTAELCLVLLKS